MIKIIINESILFESVNRSLIVEAINDTRICTIKYQGQRFRTIEPYVYGELRNGRLAIRAFQISGFTKTNNNSWKIFLLDEIDEFNITDDKFIPNRSLYNPDDRGFQKIIVNCEKQ